MTMEKKTLIVNHVGYFLKMARLIGGFASEIFSCCWLSVPTGLRSCVIII